jgi:formylglycine-generating enzyme required for sulfatase activity
MGLTDMAGNVWEWMANPYVEKFDPREAISDQVETDAFALRGGAWLSDPDDTRCSSRDGDIPIHWNDDVGFRVVLSLAE